jgi:hypothetical protein
MWQTNSNIFISKQNGTNWTYTQLGFSSFLDKTGAQIQGNDVPTSDLPAYLMGFGIGSDKEMYVLTSGNPGPTGSSGKVWKMMPG